jgi:hypothetical protein
MSLLSVPVLLSMSVPVDPDAPQAHDWLVQELAKPEYQAAKPTWFDLASKAVQDWLASLFSTGSGSSDGLLLFVIVLLGAGLLAVAFVVFGLPRLNRRARAKTTSLFGADDTRDAARGEGRRLDGRRRRAVPCDRAIAGRAHDRDADARHDGE